MIMAIINDYIVGVVDVIMMTSMKSNVSHNGWVDNNIYFTISSSISTIEGGILLPYSPTSGKYYIHI